MGEKKTATPSEAPGEGEGAVAELNSEQDETRGEG